MIVVAGRHQYAHWEDEGERGFSRFADGVFNRLLDVYMDDITRDMVLRWAIPITWADRFVRTTSCLAIFIGPVMNVYRADMMDMLAGGEGA